MPHKDESGRNAAIHHNDAGKTPPAGRKDNTRLNDSKGPGKQHPNPGDQGPHGGGEGETGMQPGAGHPRGR